MAVPNAAYASDLLAGTIQRTLRKTPTQVVFEELPLFAWLNSKNKIKRKGGSKLTEPIMYRKSTAVGSYAGMEPLNIAPQGGFTHFDFSWKHYYLAVTLDETELLINDAGDAQIIDLAEGKTEQAKSSLADQIGSDAFLDGNGNGGKNITGLAAMVANSGSYGAINRSVETWAKAVVLNDSSALSLTGAYGLRRLNNDVARGQGSMEPDLWLTTQIIFEAYEAFMDSGMRFTTMRDNNAAIPGQTLRFKKGEITYDTYCQSGTLYALQSKVISLVVHPQRDGGVENGEEKTLGDFRLGPWRVPQNQDGKTQLGFWMGNLTCRNPGRLGKRTGLTNT